MSPLPEFLATRKAIQQLPRDFYAAALAWMDAQPDSLVAARVMEVSALSLQVCNSCTICSLASVPPPPYPAHFLDTCALC